MPYTEAVKPEQAGPEVKKIYAEITERTGFLPNYFQAIARDPELLKAHVPLGAAIMKDGALPRVVKEQTGVMVSGLNTSSYCVAIHMEFLKGLGIEKAMGRKLATDYMNAAVDEKIKALFRFADKLTRQPEDFGQGDVDEVRKAGWSEGVVFETVMTVAYFNFVNRVSIGLGLVADF